MRDTLLLLWRLARRNLWRNPRRSILTVLGIGIGVWGMVGLTALARGMAAQLQADAINTLTGHIQIHAPGYLNDPALDYRFSLSDSLRGDLSRPPVVQWAGRVRVPGVVMSERRSFGVTLVGIDPLREQGLSFIGDRPSVGRGLQGQEDPGVLVGVALLEELKADVGKRLVVMSQGGDGDIVERGFPVVGVFDAELERTEKQFLFVGRKVLQGMLGIGQHLSEISLMVEDDGVVGAVAADLQERHASLEIDQWRVIEPLIDALLRVQNGFLTIWYWIVAVTVLAGVMNTLFMTLIERGREFFLYQSLGMHRSLVRLQVVIESLLVLGIGALVGTVLIFGTLWLLREGIDLSSFSQGTEKVGIGSRVHPRLLFMDWIWGVGLVVVLGVFGAYVASRHVEDKGGREQD